MAKRIDFYTIAAQQKLQVFSATSQVSGREAGFAFDNNLDSYHQATGTIAEHLILDLGSAKTIEGFSVFFRDYDLDLAGAGGVATNFVLAHATGTSGPWTSFSTITMTASFVRGVPVMMGSAVTGISKQYWRFTTNLVTSAPKIAHIFLWEKSTILSSSVTSASILPHDDIRKYNSSSLSGPGDRSVVGPSNRKAELVFRREFQTIGETDKDILAKVYDDCLGRNLPLIIVQDSGTPEVVELLDIRFDPRALHYQIYRPGLTFRTVPHHKSGEAL